MLKFTVFFFLFSLVSKRQRATPAAEEEEEVAVEEGRTDDVGASSVSRKWEEEDISNTPLPDYVHAGTSIIEAPFTYFIQCFDMDLVEHLVYQTNLYARQINLRTPFKTDTEEMIVFLGILLYMGVVHLPCIEDYWALETRVPQVADYMSSKRFRLMRARIHFNDNQQASGTADRFFKVRPVITSITNNFLRIPETPHQSVDEVMVAYKGTRAGNLRQYIQNKPHKWGYKFFCRASIDGIIHDILMYQGQTTFTTHPVQLSEEEKSMNMSAKVVLTLVQTLKHPERKSVYADNFFTSIGLVEHLRDIYKCRYVGTARDTRTGNPGLKSTAEMNKKKTKRGTLDYRSCKGVLALKWKDNKVVNLLSTDAGIEPMTTVKRYDRDAHEKIDVPCPDVIKQYNGRMGGIDKSDMLTHLYKTPLRARRWPLKIFGYVLDVCVSNAWLIYKRDIKKLAERPMSLKNFRLSISRFCRVQKKTRVFSHTRRNLDLPSTSTSSDESSTRLVLPTKGQRSPEVPQALRDDTSKQHVPVFTPMRQTCKHCSTGNNIHRSKWMCNVCNVALCLSDSRNCFASYHNVNIS